MPARNLTRWEHFLSAIGKEVKPKKTHTALKWLALGLPAAGVAGAALANPTGTSQFAHRVGNTAMDIGAKTVGAINTGIKEAPSAITGAVNSIKDTWNRSDPSKWTAPSVSLDTNALKNLLHVSAWTNGGK